jgi:Flp pilus assembly protein TadB
VAFAGYLLLTQPAYLQPLVTNPLGILLLVTAAVVFAIGVLGLRWAVSVDV